MKRNENKHLTILFIPHSAKNPLTIKISYFVIKLTISLFVVLILFSAVSLTLTRYYANQKSILAEKNEELQSERDTLYRIIDQVENIKNEMMILEQLRLKLRNKLYSDSDPGGSLEDLTLLGLLPSMGGSAGYESRSSIGDVYEEILFIRSEIPAAFDLAERTISEADSIEYELSHIPSINPTDGNVTSGFGFRKDPFLPTIRFHNGVDIPNASGTLVWASADGVVNYAGTMSGYGNIVRIQHNCSLETIYAHLDSFTVRLRDKVSRGDVIGYMGSTGRSTDPHLHYEVRIYDKPVDPMNFIKD